MAFEVDPSAQSAAVSCGPQVQAQEGCARARPRPPPDGLRSANRIMPQSDRPTHSVQRGGNVGRLDSHFFAYRRLAMFSQGRICEGVMIKDGKQSLPVGDRLMNRRELRGIVPGADMTIWRWVRQGLFPKPLIINRRRYWRASDIERWLAERR